MEPRFSLSGPADGGGDRWDKQAHLDHLHLFIGPKERREVETSFGLGTPAHVPLIVCIDTLEVYSDQLVFGAALEPRLTGDSDVIVGRLGQGLAKPGRSAPWTLDDPTEADLIQAETFLEQYATRQPDGTITLDEDAIKNARPKLESF